MKENAFPGKRLVGKSVRYDDATEQNVFVEIYENDPGMTLRDYFAGNALTGVVANDSGPAPDWAKCASDAYMAADAMLAEREKDVTAFRDTL